MRRPSVPAVLSLARVVFISTHRGWFRDRLLAELLPPLVQVPGGTTRSPLWDALGHKFTGLTYHEADRLSRFNKEFIWRLFPTMPIHACLLPEGVQDIIGQVGPNTVGAKRLLPGGAHVRELEGLPVLSLRSTPHGFTDVVLKRAMDVVLSAVGILLLSPLLGLIALLIRRSRQGRG